MGCTTSGSPPIAIELGERMPLGTLLAEALLYAVHLLPRQAGVAGGRLMDARESVERQPVTEQWHLAGKVSRHTAQLRAGHARAAGAAARPPGIVALLAQLLGCTAGGPPGTAHQDSGRFEVHPADSKTLIIICLQEKKRGSELRLAGVLDSSGAVERGTRRLPAAAAHGRQSRPRARD